MVGYENNLGDPLSEDFSKKKTAAEESPKEPHQNMRPGDDGLGLPNEEAEDIRVLAEQSSILQSENDIKLEDQEEEFQEKLRELEGLTKFLKIPSGFKRTMMLILLVLAGLCGIFIITQTLAFFRDLSDVVTSKPLMIGILTLFGLFAAIILFAIFKLIFMASSMKTSKSLNVEALNTLSERGKLQNIARKKAGEARVLLTDYLKSYPLERDSKKLLTHAGLKPEEIRMLTEARQRLLDEDMPIADGQGLEEYKRTFQATLDKVSKRMIGRYALKAGAATAASPVSFIDQAMVLYVCVSMTRDLIRIYNLRPAAGQSLIMLSFSVINIYISGTLEETTEKFMESVSESIPGSVSGAFTTLLGKASECILNGLLIWRLGKRVVSYLQPVK